MNEKKIDVLRARKFPFGIADGVLVLIVLVLTVVLLVSLYGKTGNSVVISYEGERTVLSLSQNTTRTVGGHLTVVVQDGKAWVSESDCAHRICVKTGAISRVGESIVCAQNKIVITVVGESNLAGTVGQS